MFESTGDIIRYIRHYYHSYFKLRYFLLTVIMLAAIIYVNYSHIQAFKTGTYTWAQKLCATYLLYFLPFVTAFGLQYFFYKNTAYLTKRWLWALIFLAPAFFAFKVNFNFHQPLIKHFWQGPEQFYWLSLSNLVIRIIFLVLPAVVVWWLKDKAEQPLYGFKKIATLQPYIIMLALMIPLLFWASSNPGFLKKYPVVMHIKGVTMDLKTSQVILYELFYALNFFSIEFFFRGFLILAFLRIGGLQCVIPVACFYCCIHLGKPMPEAISSFLGGILLGIISYNTKSIWGGLIIHIGIAWLLELLAFFHL